MKAPVEIGKTYGRLTITAEATPDAKWHGRRVVCLCSCGQTTVVFLKNLKRGLTSSCGCYQRECTGRRATTHGQTDTPEYKVWSRMHARCNDTRNKHYGARSIRVCLRWFSFELFLFDMGPLPSTKHSLDRIDTDGNYEPSNCRWATKKEQMRNVRTNRLVTIGERTQTVAAWLDEVRILRVTYCKRIERGWSRERAITTPIDGQHSHPRQS